MNITHTIDQQAIIALCTPRGPGAIALLRITGASALDITAAIGTLSSNKPFSDQPSHTIHHGHILARDGSVIDQVMFIIMHGPKTFTGQNTVEITCHNNPFIIETIIERAIECGARLAQPGEFSRRALFNNKMDILQAEALNELLQANTQLALKKSLAQLDGSFSSWVTRLEQELLKALALSEASFEFIDDEITFGDQIHELIITVLDNISSLKKTFNQQQHIRQGIRIALVGSVNAGKSSLFNAVLNRNRAIVSPIAGTTRDVLEAGIYRNGNYWTLVDTAGLRHTDHAIEQEGVKRSYAEAHAADIIMLIADGSRQLTPEELVIYEDLLQRYAHKMIIIHNKADLPVVDQHQLVPRAHSAVSTTTQQNISSLENLIEEKIKSILATIESPFLLNQRHYNLLLGLEKHLIMLKSMLSGDISYELVSYELKDALALLTELTGKTISEQGMDAVFREFCVGK